MYIITYHINKFIISNKNNLLINNINIRGYLILSLIKKVLYKLP